MQQIFMELGQEVVLYALYSQDLLASDYNWFCSMQHSLCGQQFQQVQDFKEFIKSKLESFFYEKIYNLLES